MKKALLSGFWIFLPTSSPYKWSSKSCVTMTYKHLVKTKSTPPYWPKMSNIKILNFRDFLCPNLLQWMLLIKQMHRLPRNMSQHSPIRFRCPKSRYLDIGALHHICSAKVLTKTTTFSVFSPLNFPHDFSSLNMKVQRLKPMLLHS